MLVKKLIVSLLITFTFTTFLSKPISKEKLCEAIKQLTEQVYKD